MMRFIKIPGCLCRSRQGHCEQLAHTGGRDSPVDLCQHSAVCIDALSAHGAPWETVISPHNMARRECEDAVQDHFMSVDPVTQRISCTITTAAELLQEVGCRFEAGCACAPSAGSHAG